MSKFEDKMAWIISHVVMPILIVVVIVLSTVGLHRMLIDGLTGADCYAPVQPPLGPKVFSFHETPYVCGDYAGGYSCVKMKPCKE